MKKLILIMMGMSLLSAKAQIKETRAIGEFKGIKLNGSMKVILAQSDSNAIRIEGNKEALGQIKTIIDDGILKIFSNENAKEESKEKAVVFVYLKSLSSIENSGSGDIETQTTVKTDQMEVISSGSGDIDAAIEANNISVSIAGSGDTRISGKTEKINCKLLGSGEFRAFQLESKEAIVKIVGSGDAFVKASQSLDANIVGSGDIIYKGNPVSRNVNIVGSGIVRESMESENDKGNTNSFSFGKGKFDFKYHSKSDRDTNKIKKEKGYDDEDFKHWSGFDIGVNGYLNSSNGLDMPIGFNYLELNYHKSISFSWNFLERDIHLYKNYINLVTGLGIEFNGYDFKNNITLKRNINVTAFSPSYDSLINYDKNQLNTTYINLPLILEFNTNKDPKKTAHIAVGIILGYNITTNITQVYKQNGHTHKIIVYDDYNLAPFRACATIRAGYAGFAVFANYSLTNMFKENRWIGSGPSPYALIQTPELHPFNVGLAINF